MINLCLSAKQVNTFNYKRQPVAAFNMGSFSWDQ